MNAFAAVSLTVMVALVYIGIPTDLLKTYLQDDIVVSYLYSTPSLAAHCIVIIPVCMCLFVFVC